MLELTYEDFKDFLIEVAMHVGSINEEEAADVVETWLEVNEDRVDQFDATKDWNREVEY